MNAQWARNNEMETLMMTRQQAFEAQKDLAAGLQVTCHGTENSNEQDLEEIMPQKASVGKKRQKTEQEGGQVLKTVYKRRTGTEAHPNIFIFDERPRKGESEEAFNKRMQAREQSKFVKFLNAKGRKREMKDFKYRRGMDDDDDHMGGGRKGKGDIGNCIDITD